MRASIFASRLRRPGDAASALVRGRRSGAAPPTTTPTPTPPTAPTRRAAAPSARWLSPSRPSPPTPSARGGDIIPRPHGRCGAAAFFSSGGGEAARRPGGGSGGGGGGGMVLYDSLTSSLKPLLGWRDDAAAAAGGAADGGGGPSAEGAGERGDGAKGLAWYTCGPTVYDSAHLGHARTYVCLDAIRRVVEHRYYSRPSSSSPASLPPPPPPLFVMNVTDVDDKILDRASELGVDPLRLARRYEREFWEDMDDLNVLRPNVVTRVTEHVESSVVPYVERIVDNGMAYVLPDGEGDGEGNGEAAEEGGRRGRRGSVYFDVRAFEAAYGGGVNRYGKLAPPSAATGAGGGGGGDFFSWDRCDGADADDADDGAPTADGAAARKRRRKCDPRDFVLWKSRPPGEESLSWDSPWGPGRPGWHIECSAMIDAAVGQFPHHRIRVHAGGVDLKFPHHANEIAQAEAYRSTRNGRGGAGREGEEWIPHWVHTGHLHIRGLKMSKSLKNFVTIREMLRPAKEREEEGGGPPSSAADGGGGTTSLSSPADDFRLWCLGLSGSYRGPATYSPDRMAEARSLREGMVRFLVDGEERLRRQCSDLEVRAGGGGDEDDDDGDIRLPPALWGEEESALSAHTAACAAACEAAVDDDLDGATYIRALIELSDAGRAYLSSSSSADAERGGSRPPEALRDALRTVRRYLSLLGFSDATVRAGMMRSSSSGDDGPSGEGGQVLGGERALAGELARFRAAVRALALADMRRAGRDGGGGGGGGTALASGCILRLCDDLRDRALPALGVEVEDGKGAGGGWRFCVPRTSGADSDDDVAAKEKSGAKGGSPTGSLDDIPVEDLFKVGQYEGMFSEYDASGVPTLNADGTEVSKRLAKKLAKKREKHVKRRQREPGS